MTETSNADATPASVAPVILCVDDEPNILSSLRRLFRAKGYQVRTAESGAAGLQMLENEEVDIVISDMRMPEMDGARFLQEVRVRWPETVRFLLTGYADVKSIMEAINCGEIYRYITKPWDEDDIVLLVRHALERKALESEKRRLEALTAAQNAELKALNASLESKVAERTAELQVANASLLRANDQLKSSYFTSIKVFSSLIEVRGGTLSGHSRRVAELARKMAHHLELDDKLQHELFVASLLHEIGKLGLPDELLSTPVALMTTKQLQQYRQHAIRGEQLLMPLPDLHNSAAAIGAQFERFDGTGYPHQLLDNEIPVSARVLTLASDFDNLQLGVLTSRKLSAGEAKAMIVQGSAKRYDPKVVAAFVAVMGGTAWNTSEPAQAGEAVVPAGDLVDGMVLARDLVGPGGQLMLSADHGLDTRLIGKIIDFERSGGAELVIHIRC